MTNIIITLIYMYFFVKSCFFKYAQIVLYNEIMNIFSVKSCNTIN